MSEMTSKFGDVVSNSLGRSIEDGLRLFYHFMVAVVIVADKSHANGARADTRKTSFLETILMLSILF